MVYRIPCRDCFQVYVDETVQHLAKRVYQHKSDEKNYKKDLEKKRVDGTALAKHARDENHVFDFDGTKILAREGNTTKRRIREVVEIIKNNTVNFKSDIENFGAMYGHIIKNYCTTNSNRNLHVF